MEKIDKNLAYLLGALRDASVDIREGKNYEIKIAQKNKKWLQKLQSIIKQKFGYKWKITKHRKNYYILRITQKKVVKKIIQLAEIKMPQILWNTPTIIRSQPLDIQKEYIKGFFDAEAGLPRNPKKWKYISFDQKAREPLEFIRKILIKLKFKPTNLTWTSEVWQFRLTRKIDIINFVEEIGSSHPDKIKKLHLLRQALDGS